MPSTAPTTTTTVRRLWAPRLRSRQWRRNGPLESVWSALKGSRGCPTVSSTASKSDRTLAPTGVVSRHAGVTTLCTVQHSKSDLISFRKLNYPLLRTHRRTHRREFDPRPARPPSSYLKLRAELCLSVLTSVYLCMYPIYLSITFCSFSILPPSPEFFFSESLVH
eukprot:04831_5